MDISSQLTTARSGQRAAVGTPTRPHAARIDVLGVHVSAITYDDVVDAVEDWVTNGDRQYVCVTGVHGVMESARDPELRAIHNRSGLTTPDGMPLVWCSHRAGAPGVGRVYGPDMMLAVMRLAVARGWSSYFYGGREGVAELLAARLADRFPGLRVAGTYSPPFRALDAQEEAEVVERINDARPDLVWVGLSTPKQERWMSAMRPRLDAPVLFGVGAAFDLHAGLLRQAPGWLQAVGLEWAFRLAVEPRRLWRRYLRNNPAFVVRILRRPPRLVIDVRDAT